jgi:hypothetical protein
MSDSTYRFCERYKKGYHGFFWGKYFYIVININNLIDPVVQIEAHRRTD